MAETCYPMSSAAYRTAMLDLAERQLAIGLSVIADSPHGYGTGYRKALAIAERTGPHVAVVECACSDAMIWRRPMEARANTGWASQPSVPWRMRRRQPRAPKGFQTSSNA